MRGSGVGVVRNLDNQQALAPVRTSISSTSRYPSFSSPSFSASCTVTFEPSALASALRAFGSGIVGAFAGRTNGPLGAATATAASMRLCCYWDRRARTSRRVQSTHILLLRRLGLARAQHEQHTHDRDSLHGRHTTSGVPLPVPRLLDVILEAELLRVLLEPPKRPRRMPSTLVVVRVVHDPVAALDEHL